jgi:hypothetical protein
MALGPGGDGTLLGAIWARRLEGSRAGGLEGWRPTYRPAAAAAVGGRPPHSRGRGYPRSASGNGLLQLLLLLLLLWGRVAPPRWK